MSWPRLFLSFACFLLCFCASHMPVFAQGCLTAGCHPDLTPREYAHEPVASGACLTCHEQSTPEHPSTLGKSFVLSDSAPKLCEQCHELAQTAKIHPPVAEGECLACHDPHGSKTAQLLKKTVPQLCYECHDTVRIEVKAKVKHAAVYRDSSCLICHSGHTSTGPSLLLATEEELCLNCHGQDDYNRSKPLRNIGTEIEGKSYRHGPVAEGKCSPCHAPHGAPYYRLLRKAFPAGPYAPFFTKVEIYALCIECHDNVMLSSEETSTDTGFRNNSRNLHYLHVAKAQKGRVCTSCHASHASNNPKMINSGGVSFGGWDIPINFSATSTGGSCAPGCHKAVSYDRRQP